MPMYLINVMFLRVFIFCFIIKVIIIIVVVIIFAGIAAQVVVVATAVIRLFFWRFTQPNKKMRSI